jgi:polyisoprenoid-binding protein YceI
MPRLFFALMLFTANVGAAEYVTLLPEQSRLTFRSKQMGVPVEGHFKKFGGTILFNPDRPETGRAQIDVDLTSIDAGSPDANDEVKTKGWFNLREFPTARFAAEPGSLRALGKGRYEAKGKISIKGKTRDAVVSFDYKADGTNAVLEGVIPILRTQYGVGDGPWADTSVVADEVPVKFRFVLAPNKPPTK